MTVQTSEVKPDELVARFHAEQAAQSDKGLTALLLHECAVLAEGLGDKGAAVRDYLAASKADPHFREPLEALARLFARSKEAPRLAEVLGALVDSARTPEERSHALWERAAQHQATGGDLATARAWYEEAIAQEPSDPASWLELEVCAARDGDTVTRMRALEARAERATDATWKAHLQIELAGLLVAAREVERAYDVLAAAGALSGKARYRAQLALESVSAKLGNLASQAGALEAQARLIEDAIGSEQAGDDTGVPRFARSAAHAADALMRAAGLRGRTGEGAVALTLLDRAVALLPDSEVVRRARLAAVETSGDTARAAELARAELERAPGGFGAEALWLRVAEAAELAGNSAGALDALRSALRSDPRSIPARSLEIDWLGRGTAPAALAASLAAVAEGSTAGVSRARAHVLAAFVYGAEAKDADAARRELAAAAQHGIVLSTIARMARMLAALSGDVTWYESESERLLELGVSVEEAQSLWFELGRGRLLRGDEAGAGTAFATLATRAAPGGGAWLGRALGAYALGVSKEGAAKPRSPEAVEALAEVEPDAAAARALRVVAALRSSRNGDTERALFHLRGLHREHPGDVVVATFLSELERRGGTLTAGAAALSACSNHCEDPDLGASLGLEAALLLWRANDHAGAVREIEEVQGRAPRAAATLLGWALRGPSATSEAGLRRALDAALDAGASPEGVAIERFGLEAALGNSVDARAALETLEGSAEGDLAVAAALGRLLWAGETEGADAASRALDCLDAVGSDAAIVARAERFRLARAEGGDVYAAQSRAAAWAAADPKLHAALEWLGANVAAGDRGAEIDARRLIAGHFNGEARAAVQASAAMVEMLDQPNVPLAFVEGDSPAAQLMNLELAPPGCDPRRRAAALKALRPEALGDEAHVDALALAGWSDLAAGDLEAAGEAFRAVLARRPGDVAAWEGVRAASEGLGDRLGAAEACSQLGALCSDAVRGGEFWEWAGLLLSELPGHEAAAERAFGKAFERSPILSISFDRLFRAVRARNEDDRLLELVSRRLDATDVEEELVKLYWERARVLRRKGDLDAAISSLENVTMLEPDHVGALALAGEVLITKGAYAAAAPALARLTSLAAAPKQQRLMSGIAAVDLFETKLGQPEKALEVLLHLHAAGLSNLPVRERLARVAVRTGAWTDAITILESLMHEREKREGRLEAARLAMALWRDKLGTPRRAEQAVAKLLDEVPDDAEAVSFILDNGFDSAALERALGRAKMALLTALSTEPRDADRIALLAKLASYEGETNLRQATLGCLVALGRETPEIADELSQLDARVAKTPQVALDAKALVRIADPDDMGPIAELFAMMAETAGLVLGPSLMSLGVAKKDRIEPRRTLPLRVAVAEWMGAVGFGEFELYVGGTDPRGVNCVAAEQPTIVLGSAVTAPFDAATRSAVAREVFALRRGTVSVRARDDAAVASFVIATCIEAGIDMPAPQYAIYGEISRALKRELSRKVRKIIPEACQRIRSSGQDPRKWATAARHSMDRMATLAAGDVSLALASMLGADRAALGRLVPDSERAKRMLAFVLSPSYLELRKALGMGVR